MLPQQQELFNCSVPSYSNLLSNAESSTPSVECYTTLISLTAPPTPSSSTAKGIELPTPIICCDVSNSIGLLGCSKGEVYRVDLTNRTAQLLSTASLSTPSPRQTVSSFSGLAAATTASAAGVTKASRTPGKNTQHRLQVCRDSSLLLR